MIFRCAIFILQITYGCNGCFRTDTKVLTDSYIPVVIQTLLHYKTQLQEYFPYKYTGLCESRKKDTVLYPLVISKDVCVEESLRRIDLFLIHLQSEAVRQKLEDFQGFGRSVLSELEKTSHLTSVQQLYFVLKKLQQERKGNAALKCKTAEFLRDLDDRNSKLYRNLLNVKPLNYLY